MSVQRLHQPSTDEIDCVKFITISKATNEKSKYEALWLEDLSFTEVKLFYCQWNFETGLFNKQQMNSCSMLIFFAICLCESHINMTGYTLCLNLAESFIDTESSCSLRKSVREITVNICNWHLLPYPLIGTIKNWPYQLDSYHESISLFLKLILLWY